MTIASSSVRVTGSQLQPFEPARLGALAHKYRQILNKLPGKRQSEILQIIETAARRLPSDSMDADTQALRVALLVLRDYVVAGHYPLVRNGRCFLANVSDSESLSPAQQRDVLRHRYRAARERALRDRGQLQWVSTLAKDIAGLPQVTHDVIDALQQGPPEVRLIDTREAGKEDVLPRALWRAVRATWSMGPEASAPGRENAFLVVDRRWPQCPLAILQFRNVVPEITARDLWLGVSAGNPAAGANRGGFLGRLAADPSSARNRAAQTRGVLEDLLSHVRRDGVALDFNVDNIEGLQEAGRRHREAFNRSRRQREDLSVLGNVHLQAVKRAQTAAALLRGVRALKVLEDSGDASSLSGDDIADLDAGLGKLWHYHMGFVAMEMSICGAAPPFGPLRVGKLAAALAGTQEVIDAWGIERPLGVIAQEVYDPAVRTAVPNPGPLVIFTSGLFPGHSAQYNRVASGGTRWTKIGDTSGFGSFHISPETADAMRTLNEAADGYAHITRTFGEGSGAKFRSVGKALSWLDLPDFRKHETRRPLYALPLVPNPQAVLLGWEPAARATRPHPAEVAQQWWTRWVADASEAMATRSRSEPDLTSTIYALAAGVRRLGEV